MGVMTANVTSLTVNNLTPGADFLLRYTQSAVAGPYHFAPTGYTVCDVSQDPTSGYWTEIHFHVDSSGAALTPGGCASSDPTLDLTAGKNLPLAGLATQAADTVVLNASGGAASPTAVALPTGGTNGCAGASDAIGYNNSTHTLVCNTISTSTVSINGTSVSSPNLNNTTPAAEAGYQNAKLQASGSSISIEVPQAPVAYTVNTSAATTYTLQASDNASVLYFSASSPVTLTVPTGLGAGFNVIIEQAGTGVVNFAGSGTTLHQRAGSTSTTGQWSRVLLTSDTDTSWEMSGALTGAILSGDVPNNAANTSGTAADLSATLSVPHGGTAQTSVPGSSGNYLYNNGGSYGAKALTQTHAIGCGVGDPAGSALTTGVLCYVVAPTTCTIQSWDILVDSGTATVDIWKIASGTAIPTVSNSIVASAAPAIATGTAIHSATLTGWTTSVAQYDIFGFNLTTTSGTKYIYTGVNCNENK